MSYNYSSYLSENVVDKILEQGQKLRSSMVETILKNDPLVNPDVMFKKHHTTPVSSYCDLIKTPESNLDDKLLNKYLKGDYLSKEEEKKALDTFRSMTDEELCKTTARTYNSSTKSVCNCLTCKQYNTNDLNCDLKRLHKVEIEKHKCDTNCEHDVANYVENKTYLKFVDSIKIAINSLVLTQSGNLKVSCDYKTNVPLNISQTFFLEYTIPDLISKYSSKSKSRTNSNLDDNLVRFCARRNNTDDIHFKQVTIHDINIESIDLNEVELVFKISFRNYRQKNASIFGFAKICLSLFQNSKNLTLNKGISIYMNEKTPILLGTLKVSLQLGCGKIYFGKDFIDAIDSNQNYFIDIPSDESDFKSENRLNFTTERTYKRKFIEEKTFENLSNTPSESKTKLSSKLSSNRNQIFTNKKSIDLAKQSSYFPQTNITNNPKPQILFGYFYISEAEFLNRSYSCSVNLKPFCQDTTCSSKHTAESYNPHFNFSQSVPLILSDDLLLKFRENYTILEILDKNDKLIGYSKVCLHQFYISYRNPVISSYLIENSLPIISNDDWEPIICNKNEDIIGNINVLYALGTETQIKNLLTERGFNKNIVKPKPYSKTIKNPLNLNKEIPPQIELEKNKNSTCDKETNVDKVLQITKSTNTKLISKETCTIGVQSDNKMDPSKNNIPDSIEKLLSKINRPMTVENSTNTENTAQATTENETNNVNSQLKSTEDLLSSLEKALTTQASSMEQPKTKEDTFKVHINILEAMHLPSRKKCKAKRSKCRQGKFEESVLPSTYVSFECYNDELKVTQVIGKSTTPKWSYRCDAELQADLLLNPQKRLIFKVWRKSTNTHLQPNMQTDMVFGFAAIDLTVLLAGFPNIQGWFNIVDFSGKCNGQINIHVTPLENLARFQSLKLADQSVEVDKINGMDTDKLEDEQNSEPGELLGRALKRKFTELDEITQRLRLRLSKVTEEESDVSNDDIAEEFENDINNLCIEEDYDLINFDEIEKINENQKKLENGTQHVKASSSNMSILSIDTEQSDKSEENKSESENISLERNLLQGKQRIDTLLEKLTLISADQAFSNRYVSGCSKTDSMIDTEAILHELDSHSRPNICHNSISNSEMFQDLYKDSTSTNTTGTSEISESELRPAPEGKGTSIDGKMKGKLDK